MTAGIRVLGPLEAEVDGARADLGGPLQRAVLALLLMERGRVVSVDRMIDRLWRGEPPPRAIASLQAYVSNLRRILEPERERRAPARILVSAPPGYALRLPDDAVDAWRFESLLTAARQVAPKEPERARHDLGEALALWRGPAYAEFADEEWAAAEIARLTEQHLAAQEAWAEIALRTGAAAEAVPTAEALIRQQPLREGSWRLLALSLWACDRQGDALAALRRARRILRDELGLAPGPALTEVEEAILGQRQEVLHRAKAPLTPAASRISHANEPARAQDDLFVGRGDELRAIAAAAAQRTGGVVLITGEGGAGKSRLLDQAAGQLAEAGWTVVTGTCPDVGGAPSAWAWTEALRALAEHAPPAEPAEALGALLDSDARPAGPVPENAPDASAARFRLHQAVLAWLRDAAASGPVAVLLDDLHQADAETLALLETVAAGLAGSALLLMAAYRPAEASGELEQALAVLARRSPARLPLAGLPAPDAAALISSVYGGPVGEHIVEALAVRTGGNPFYLKESARLLASEGALVAVSEVPEGVRDVLRRRLSRLPPPAVALLRLAAAVGQEADVDVLVDAADTDEDGVIAGLEAGVIAGLLTEPAPGRVRFVHALVRDTVYADLTQLRLTRMHARVGAAIRRLRPDDVPALAHHYLRAASADTARAAVGYAIQAAERADRRYAYDAAVSLLEQALDVSARTPGPESERAEQQAGLLGRLLRAQIRAGRIAAARATRQRAADAAVPSSVARRRRPGISPPRKRSPGAGARPIGPPGPGAPLPDVRRTGDTTGRPGGDGGDHPGRVRQVGQDNVRARRGQVRGGIAAGRDGHRAGPGGQRGRHVQRRVTDQDGGLPGKVQTVDLAGRAPGLRHQFGPDLVHVPVRPRVQVEADAKPGAAKLQCRQRPDVPGEHGLTDPGGGQRRNGLRRAGQRPDQPGYRAVRGDPGQRGQEGVDLGPGHPGQREGVADDSPVGPPGLRRDRDQLTAKHLPEHHLVQPRAQAVGAHQRVVHIPQHKQVHQPRLGR